MSSGSSSTSSGSRSTSSSECARGAGADGGGSGEGGLAQAAAGAGVGFGGRGLAADAGGVAAALALGGRGWGAGGVGGAGGGRIGRGGAVGVVVVVAVAGTRGAAARGLGPPRLVAASFGLGVGAGAAGGLEGAVLDLGQIGRHLGHLLGGEQLGLAALQRLAPLLRRPDLRHDLHQGWALDVDGAEQVVDRVHELEAVREARVRIGLERPAHHLAHVLRQALAPLVQAAHALAAGRLLLHVLEHPVVDRTPHHDLEGDEGEREQVGGDVLRSAVDPLGRRVAEGVLGQGQTVVLAPGQHLDLRDAVAEDHRLAVALEHQGPGVDVAVARQAVGAARVRRVHQGLGDEVAQLEAGLHARRAAVVGVGVDDLGDGPDGARRVDEHPRLGLVRDQPRDARGVGLLHEAEAGLQLGGDHRVAGPGLPVDHGHVLEPVARDELDQVERRRGDLPARARHPRDALGLRCHPPPVGLGNAFLPRTDRAWGSARERLPDGGANPMLAAMVPTIDGYEVVRLLGGGGMGRVYLVEHTAHRTVHALKVLRFYSAALSARLRTEGRLQATLHHDNIVRVHDVVEASGQPAVVMEYVPGPTLSALVGLGYQFSPAEVDALGRGIVAGVAAAHARGWVHRDLKPDNILLATIGSALVPKVADFGLVKVLDDDGRADAGTTTRHGVGTRRYMSLEQLVGAPVDQRMDVFSLGALLYEIAEGIPAFPTIADWERAIRHDRVPAVGRSDLPDRIRRAIALALGPHRDRPAQAEALLALWADGAPLVPPSFRPETLREAGWLSRHLTDDQIAAAAVDPDAEAHMSACARCRTAFHQARGFGTGSGDAAPTWADAGAARGAFVVGLASREGALDVTDADRVASGKRGRAVTRALTEPPTARSPILWYTFDEATDALNAATDLIAAAPARDAAPTAVVHTGDDPDVVSAEADRIAEVGLAGQVLCTQPVLAQIADFGRAPEVVPHGKWRFDGIVEPLALFEASPRDGVPLGPPPDGIRAWRLVLREGAWVPLKPPGHRLPREGDRFVGRDDDLVAIAEAVGAGARIVTVHGAGGVGKTRLAVRYARTWLGAWPGGAWFCDLSEATSADGIAVGVARGLGVPLGEADAIDQLGHALAARGRCLLVVDNVEQIVDRAREALLRWVAAAPEAVFVVTSRVPVGEGALVALEPLDEERSIALFVDRARAARPDLDPDADRAPIRALAAALDGIPLAIELCAARVRMMRPEQLAARMGQRFRVLAGGTGRPDRHATLEATIGWSVALLPPEARSALAQLSVFEGGFTLDAAETVVDLSAFDGPPWVVDAVQVLAEGALVRRLGSTGDEDAPTDRFGMLSSVRDYALAMLAEAGSGVEVERRHGGYFARTGSDEALAALEGAGGSRTREALAHDLDNLVAASREAIARGEGEIAAGAALAAWEVLRLRGPFELGAAVLLGACEVPSPRSARLWAEAANATQLTGTPEAAMALAQRALQRAQADGDRAIEAIAWGYLCALRYNRGQFEEARSAVAEALTIARAIGDRHREGISLHQDGLSLLRLGRIGDAVAAFEASLAIMPRPRQPHPGGDHARHPGPHAPPRGPHGRSPGALRGSDRDLARPRRPPPRGARPAPTSGICHLDQGRNAMAERAFEASLAVHREVGDRLSEGFVLGSLGRNHIEAGRTEDAAAAYRRALDIHRTLCNRTGEAIMLDNLGQLYIEEERFEEAEAHLAESLQIFEETGNRRSCGIVHGNLGVLHQRRRSFDAAAAAFETALAIHREVGNRHSEGMAIGNIGRLYLARDLPDRAEPWLRRERGRPAGGRRRDLDRPRDRRPRDRRAPPGPNRRRPGAARRSPGDHRRLRHRPRRHDRAPDRRDPPRDRPRRREIDRPPAPYVADHGTPHPFGDPDRAAPDAGVGPDAGRERRRHRNRSPLTGTRRRDAGKMSGTTPRSPRDASDPRPPCRRPRLCARPRRPADDPDGGPARARDHARPRFVAHRRPGLRPQRVVRLLPRPRRVPRRDRSGLPGDRRHRRLPLGARSVRPRRDRVREGPLCARPRGRAAPAGLRRRGPAAVPLRRQGRAGGGDLDAGGLPVGGRGAARHRADRARAVPVHRALDRPADDGARSAARGGGLPAGGGHGGGTGRGGRDARGRRGVGVARADGGVRVRARRMIPDRARDRSSGRAHRSSASAHSRAAAAVQTSPLEV